MTCTHESRICSELPEHHDCFEEVHTWAWGSVKGLAAKVPIDPPFVEVCWHPDYSLCDVSDQAERRRYAHLGGHRVVSLDGWDVR